MSSVEEVLEVALPNALPGEVGGDSYVAGEENALIAAAAWLLFRTEPGRVGWSTAEATGRRLLVLYGPSGVGKSHLGRGVAWKTQQCDPNAEIVLTSGADLGRTSSAVTEPDSLWRQIDRAALIVIDDLEPVADKPNAQTALRSRLDAADARGAAVIVAAKTHPLEIPRLSDALRGRLCGGLVAPLVHPGNASRGVLARRFAERLDLPRDKATLERIVTNARTVFDLQAAVHGRNPVRQPLEAPTLEEIVATAAEAFGYSTNELTGRSRRQALVEARNIVVFVARRLTGASYLRIGAALGGRDHTTTMHGMKRIQEELGRRTDLRLKIDRLEQELTRGTTR